MALLNVQNLTVRFDSGSKPVVAVSNLSFSIDPGETVAVVGESGSGKTTAALALAMIAFNLLGDALRDAVDPRFRLPGR